MHHLLIYTKALPSGIIVAGADAWLFKSPFNMFLNRFTNYL